MTFDQVLVFHKIIESGSFKAAAAELHRTQPAVSLAVKKLEEEIAVALFDRSGYRPTLTAHGRAFFERSLKVLQGMAELEGLARSFQRREEPELAVAVDGISPLPKLLPLFKAFSERFPNTRLNLSFEILSEAERRVLTGTAQIGITHFVSEGSALEVQPITSVTMVPVISRELYRNRKIRTEADLLAIDQVVVGDKGGPGGTSFGLLEGGKQWRIGDSNFKREVILAGLGWGHLTERSIERELAEKKLVVLEFDDVRPRRLVINLIRNKKHPLGIVAKGLWDELLGLAGKSEKK
jgi:DNA-binding transcriptional LysR family regulator